MLCNTIAFWAPSGSEHATAHCFHHHALLAVIDPFEDYNSVMSDQYAKAILADASSGCAQITADKTRGMSPLPMHYHCVYGSDIVIININM